MSALRPHRSSTQRRPNSAASLGRAAQARYRKTPAGPTLWRSQNILEEDEIVVSQGPAEHGDAGGAGSDDIISITLYPLPALAQMVVKEFSTIATVADGEPISDAPDTTVIETKVEPEPIADVVAASISVPVKTPAQQADQDRYETLSGLPVSLRLIDSIAEYLDQPQSDTACGALLLIDLDHFNSINESCLNVAFPF